MSSSKWSTLHRAAAHVATAAHRPLSGQASAEDSRGLVFSQGEVQSVGESHRVRCEQDTRGSERGASQSSVDAGAARKDSNEMVVLKRGSAPNEPVNDGAASGISEAGRLRLDMSKVVHGVATAEEKVLHADEVRPRGKLRKRRLAAWRRRVLRPNGLPVPLLQQQQDVHRVRRMAKLPAKMGAMAALRCTTQHDRQGSQDNTAVTMREQHDRLGERCQRKET